MDVLLLLTDTSLSLSVDLKAAGRRNTISSFFDLCRVVERKVTLQVQVPRVHAVQVDARPMRCTHRPACWVSTDLAKLVSNH